jgi:hypothetical protein
MRRGFAGVGARYPAPRRGAELHKRSAEASGETRSSDFTRIPAEWRIGSPVIEAAWNEAAHMERNDGVGHGTPKSQDNAGQISFDFYSDKDIIDAKMGIDEQVPL